MKNFLVFAATIGLTLAGVGNTSAQEAKSLATSPIFTSPKGFTITPPAGWKVDDADATKQLTDSVHEKLKNVPDANANMFAMVMHNSADPTGAQNINVVATQSVVPLDEAGVEGKIEKLLRDEYQKVGVTVAKMSVAKRTFGTNTGLVADLESNAGGAQVRQWQVFFPTGNQTLVVTCTSSPSNFDSAIPAFTQALSSMTFPKPDEKRDVPSWLTGAGIGLGIGAGLVISRKFKAKKG